MRGIVGFLQTLSRDVGIDLRRGEVRVAEQLLDAAQIRAGVEQMGGITMAEFVRRQARVQPGEGEILL